MSKWNIADKSEKGASGLIFPEGVFFANPVAFNPTQQEATENGLLFLGEYVKQKYNATDPAEAPHTRLVFHFKLEELNKVLPYTVRLSMKPQLSSKGSVRVINAAGSATWVKLYPQVESMDIAARNVFAAAIDHAEALQMAVDTLKANPKMSWFKTDHVQLLMDGEMALYELIMHMINYPGVVKKMDASEKDIAFKNNILDMVNIKDVYDGKFQTLEELVQATHQNTFRVFAYVTSRDVPVKDSDGNIVIDPATNQAMTEVRFRSEVHNQFGYYVGDTVEKFAKRLAEVTVGPDGVQQYYNLPYGDKVVNIEKMKDPANPVYRPHTFDPESYTAQIEDVPTTSSPDTSASPIW